MEQFKTQCILTPFLIFWIELDFLLNMAYNYWHLHLEYIYFFNIWLWSCHQLQFEGRQVEVSQAGKILSFEGQHFSPPPAPYESKNILQLPPMCGGTTIFTGILPWKMAYKHFNCLLYVIPYPPTLNLNYVLHPSPSFQPPSHNCWQLPLIGSMYPFLDIQSMNKI